MPSFGARHPRRKALSAADPPSLAHQIPGQLRLVRAARSGRAAATRANRSATAGCSSHSPTCQTALITSPRPALSFASASSRATSALSPSATANIALSA